MSEQLSIHINDFRNFLSPIKTLRPKVPHSTKTDKSVYIERISYVLSETTFVLNDYPDDTFSLITDKDLLRVLMGDLWLMYYGGKS